MIPALQIALAVFLWVLSLAIVIGGIYFAWATLYAHRAYLALKGKMESDSTVTQTTDAPVDSDWRYSFADNRFLTKRRGSGRLL